MTFQSNENPINHMISSIVPKGVKSWKTSLIIGVPPDATARSEEDIRR